MDTAKYPIARMAIDNEYTTDLFMLFFCDWRSGNDYKLNRRKKQPRNEIEKCQTPIPDFLQQNLYVKIFIVIEHLQICIYF